MQLLLLVPLFSFLFCLGISQGLARRGEGRARRVLRIAQVLAWMLTALTGYYSVKVVLGDPHDDDRILNLALTALYLLASLGAWANVAFSAQTTSEK